MPEQHPQPEGRQGDPKAGKTLDDADIVEDEPDVDDEPEHDVEDLDVDDEAERVKGGEPIDGKGNDVMF